MSKSTLSVVATSLAIFGVAVVLGHPPWGAVTGAAILILAGGLGAGAVRSPSEDYTLERRGAGQKISNGLVTLSSAAILAVYAVGYHRTGPAADKFEEQAVRRRMSAPISADAVARNMASTTVVPRVEAPPTAPRSLTPKHRTVDAQNRSKPVPKVKSAPASAGELPVTPSAPPTSAAEPDSADAAGSKAHYKDGTFLGWGSSRHGDIQASVVIRGGRIVSTAIAQCWTRYSCSVIIQLPGEVVSRQSAAIDLVSGATESSDAFSDAVSEALSKANE